MALQAEENPQQSVDHCGPLIWGNGHLGAHCIFDSISKRTASSQTEAQSFWKIFDRNKGEIVGDDAIIIE